MKKFGDYVDLFGDFLDDHFIFGKLKHDILKRYGDKNNFNARANVSSQIIIFHRTSCILASGPRTQPDAMVYLCEAYERKCSFEALGFRQKVLAPARREHRRTGPK